jgi:hypothetical protein
MAYSLTLPTIGVLALGGAALGMHLGDISVAEINPIYFQEPPTRFHADLAAYRSTPTAGYDAQTDAAAPVEVGTSCVGCRTYPEEYNPVHDPAVDAIAEDRAAQPALVVLASAGAGEAAAPAERDPALDRLQRYAQFAVTAEEPKAPASDEASAVQGDEIASTR